jgi:outer membrane lipase/esterase
MKFSTPHLLAAVALAASTLAHAQDPSALTPPYSALYVFGDSLSDSGNNRAALGFNGPNPTSATFVPSLPYAPSNTYSNGATWVTPFAAGLGLSAINSAPSLVGGGHNYAYGGATTSTTTPPALFPPSLQLQVGQFLGSSPSGVSSSLFVLAGGGNDARALASIAGGPTPTDVLNAATLYASTTLQMVNQLKAAGAQNIIVWNVPDLGKTPAAGSGVGAGAAGATQIASTFNSFLSGALAGSGVTIFDTFGTIQNVVANPGAYGFGNVTQACGFAGNGCSASNALFWDGIHPTAFAQNFIANQMLAVAVPEPATYALFALGVAGLGAVVRRRRQAAQAIPA